MEILLETWAHSSNSKDVLVFIHLSFALLQQMLIEDLLY